MVWYAPSVARRTSLVVGDLVARVEAPTMSYRVTERFPKHIRVLPYRRSGREQCLVPIGMTWIGDGSQWLVVGHD